jgi:hypothetical protein
LLSFILPQVAYWARIGWWCGLVAAVLNILLVPGILMEGERIVELMFWWVPIVVIWLLCFGFGWQPSAFA